MFVFRTSDSGASSHSQNTEDVHDRTHTGVIVTNFQVFGNAKKFGQTSRESVVLNRKI